MADHRLHDDPMLGKGTNYPQIAIIRKSNTICGGKGMPFPYIRDDPLGVGFVQSAGKLVDLGMILLTGNVDIP